MFKAVLKKNRDGGKGSKKDSGMWNIKEEKQQAWIKKTSLLIPPGLDTNYISAADVQTLHFVFVLFPLVAARFVNPFLALQPHGIFHRHSSC